MNAPQRRYEPPLSPVKSEDPVLRLVVESTDSAALVAGLSQTDLNAQRGTTGLTALGAAASAGNLVAVRALLTLGAGIEVRSRNGETALESAVINAQASTACWLLLQGAQLPVPDKKPYLLPAAALSEDFAAANTLVRMLLERGFSPDARMSGDTALHIASELGNVDLVRALMQRRADLAAKNSRGNAACCRQIQRAPNHREAARSSKGAVMHSTPPRCHACSRSFSKHKVSTWMS